MTTLPKIAGSAQHYLNIQTDKIFILSVNKVKSFFKIASDVSAY
jgi:hypothetical protein